MRIRAEGGPKRASCARPEPTLIGNLTASANFGTNCNLAAEARPWPPLWMLIRVLGYAVGTISGRDHPTPDGRNQITCASFKSRPPSLYRGFPDTIGLYSARRKCKIAGRPKFANRCCLQLVFLFPEHSEPGQPLLEFILPQELLYHNLRSSIDHLFLLWLHPSKLLFLFHAPCLAMQRVQCARSLIRSSRILRTTCITSRLSLISHSRLPDFA